MKRENKLISIIKLEIQDEIDSNYSGKLVRLNTDYESKVIDTKEYQLLKSNLLLE